MRTVPAERPPWWRVLLAFAVAPAVAASVFAAYEPLYGGLSSYVEQVWYSIAPVAMVGGYAPTLVLGVPLYLLLCRRVRPTYLACAIAGAAVASLPWLVLSLLPSVGDASIGGRATVIDGHVTWYGVLAGLKAAGETGVFGAIGGLAFRLVAGRGRAEGEAT